MPFPHQFSRLIDNPLRRFIIAPGKLVLRLSLRGDERILELGPGSGYFSGHLAEAVPKGILHLLDVQPQMLEKARRRLLASGIDNVAYTTLDAGGSFPFADSHFDVAVMVSVLGEVANQRSCLDSLARVLRDNGLLAIHESIPDPDMISFDRLVALVEPSGFALSARTGPAWNYTALFSNAMRGQ